MMILSKFTLFTLLLLMILGDHEGSLSVLAKKSKKKKTIEYPEISSHKRPTDIKPELYCEACNALIE